MAEEIYFKNEGHKQHLQDVLQRLHKYDGNRYDSQYCAALYVLTGMHGDIAENKELISPSGIGFAELLKQYGYSDTEDVLIRFAGSLFNRSLHMDPIELSILDEQNFRVALDALRIIHYGLKTDFTLRNRYGV